jgi:hypothetical protein
MDYYLIEHLQYFLTQGIIENQGPLKCVISGLEVMNAECRPCTGFRMKYVLPCLTELGVCVIGGKTRDYKLFEEGSFNV